MKTTLNQAKIDSDLGKFIAEHQEDSAGNSALFNATLEAMAGKSKAVPATSNEPENGD
jgi:hypothetical protein